MGKLSAIAIGAGGVLLAADWRAGVTSGFRDLRNPFDRNRAAVSSGRKLFRGYCADCHGNKAFGTAHGPSLHSERVAKSKPGELMWLLQTGRPAAGMPSLSFLSEKELWQVITFLGTLQ